ncbi:MAG: hypothetical protein GWN99_12770 [Gemmatimonadetes bacterium]|uniref:Lipoprotein n=1 Tax=Candidatus Kutchimonas denitrificans TaxID=3056748 RepID=A0AAE4Z866_9BACT|nr:hypothetical protein [Gemmatimonadota bacterium]NIR75605.1 hypothetical protein [Candidatus Kutchimonas denitrificans]NIS01919.1 hypothetical protein [Gemmatimonadota bacterium]NIT67700.1 hypothetical protein [Gemmatimonadota bacterium]NIU53574.1 hypothetical protein [Gemmatimonadota bacterium]
MNERHAIRLALVALLALAVAACSDEPTAPGSQGEDEGSPSPSPGPALAIAEPELGAMLDLPSATGGPVAVSGQACDPVNPIVALRAAGSDVPVSGDALCESFDVTQTAGWGMTIVGAMAATSAADTSFAVRSYLAADRYFAAAGEPSADARAERGAVLRLGASALDDGDREDVDDLATILWWSLKDRDFDPLVPDLLAVDPDVDGDGFVDLTSHDCLLWTEVNHRTGYRVTKNGPFTHGGFQLGRLAAVPGGLEFEMEMSRPEVPLYIRQYQDLACLGEIAVSADGAVRAERLVGNGRFLVSLGADGTPEVEADGIVIDVQSLVVDLGDGLLDELIEEVIDGVKNEFEAQVETMLAGALEEELGPGLVTFLDELELDGPIELPAPLAAALIVDSQLDGLTFGDGHAELGLAMQLYPETPRAPLDPTGHGAVFGGGEPPVFQETGHGVALALKDDVLNQVLWAAWQAGAFDLQELPGLAGSDDVTTFAALPPVVMPDPGEPARVVIGWGDLRIEAAFDAAAAGDAGLNAGRRVDVEGYISALIGGSIVGGSAAAGFRFEGSGEPEVHVQIDSFEGSRQRTTVGRLFEDYLQTTLVEFLGEAVGAVPLPQLDLTAIAPDVPDPRLALRIAAVERHGRYHLLLGDLE